MPLSRHLPRSTSTHARSTALRGVGLLLTSATLAAGLGASGCGPAYRTWYNEGGSGAAIDQYTWISRPHEPKSVMLVDTRTESVFWSVDIPVGKQLTVRFYEDESPENIQTPALMRWDLQDAGTNFRRLENAQLVPPANSRRLEWEFRPAPEAEGA